MKNNYNNISSMLGLITQLARTSVFQIAVKQKHDELLQLLETEPPVGVDPIETLLNKLGYENTISAIEDELLKSVAAVTKKFAALPQATGGAHDRQ